MTPVATITRPELAAIIDRAATGYDHGVRSRLLAVAERTEAVAVGDWYVGDTGCPVWQARIRKVDSLDSFVRQFDAAMHEGCRRRGQFVVFVIDKQEATCH